MVEYNEEREFNLEVALLAVSSENHHTWVSIGTSFAVGLLLAGAALNTPFGLGLSAMGGLLYGFTFIVSKISWSKSIQKKAYDIRKTYIGSKLTEEAEDETEENE